MSTYFVVEVEPHKKNKIVAGTGSIEHLSKAEAEIELDYLNMTTTKTHRIVSRRVLEHMESR